MQEKEPAGLVGWAERRYGVSMQTNVHGQLHDERKTTGSRVPCERIFPQVSSAIHSLPSLFNAP